MNLLTKFHEDRTVNVASRVLTRFYYRHIRKNAPPLNWKPFFPSKHYYIIGMNLLTEFHEDRTINVASRVLKDFTIALYSHIQKNAQPLGGHVFQANVTIFELIQNIIKTNLLTKFHEDWTINVASRVLTRFYYSHIRKNAPPPGGHVFQPTGIIFDLVQDIIGMNLLTKKNAPPLSSHVFQAKVTISELIQDINRKKNVASLVLTRKNAPPPGGHVFQPTDTIFKHFYLDQTINVASSVKNAPPLVIHVFQANVTIFELIQDIIETNLLTKFHEDWTINANVDIAGRTTDTRRQTKGDHKSSP
ncbi:hypothetical protein DPMN_078573 [Dreissena polymorpha]|uniref:Uncharacterized protein n=1 Tax=Dreissena polymorpha TaxID=45954 RepID=A0A9D3YP25_DREPO|nr:hypothetical protein DPMN_078573 [Dreissena polymorpha]